MSTKKTDNIRSLPRTPENAERVRRFREYMTGNPDTAVVAVSGDLPWWFLTVVAHKVADAKCGRAWSCACGACRAARAVTHGP